MTYPEEFISQPDEDGDSVRISERTIGRELRIAAADDLAWVKRADIPDMIEWLQAYYDATEPPKVPLPTVGGSRIEITYKVDTQYDEAILVDDSHVGPVWRVIKRDGTYGFFGYFKGGEESADWSEDSDYTYEVLFDAGKEA